MKTIDINLAKRIIKLLIEKSIPTNREYFFEFSFNGEFNNINDAWIILEKNDYLNVSNQSNGLLVVKKKCNSSEGDIENLILNTNKLLKNVDIHYDGWSIDFKK